MSARIAPLAGMRLPEDGPHLREHVRPEERQSADYAALYDRTTLYYDCVALPGDAACLFTAPRFLNLWPLFRDGLRAGGVPVRRLRRRRWLRCEQVEVATTASSLTLDLGAGPAPVTLRAPETDAFAGRDCLVAVNRDNALDWIAEWARLHACHHGATGAVIIDNGSTRYAPDDVAATLAGVPGIAAALVYSAPFPYGPADRGGRFDISPRFFQTAMLNLARRDALARARAVLSIDIDEVVLPPGAPGAPETVFDAARAHPLGLVSIPGDWVYPPPGTDGPAPQQAHRFRAVPARSTNPKWCVRPGSLMDRMGWAVHRFDEVLHPLATRQRRFRLAHCRAASTGWKGKRYRVPRSVREDPALAALFEH